MSRIKIVDLFAVARKLKQESQKIDFEWLKVQRTCVRELGRLEAESARINKELSKIIKKLERTGFNSDQILTKLNHRKGKKS